MRVLTLTAVYIFFAVSAHTQIARIEFLDLVKQFAGDTAVSATILAWPTVTSKGSVRWASTIPRKEGSEYLLRGAAGITVKGKNLVCSGIESGSYACKWKINLAGNKAGYHSFSFSIDNLHIDSETEMINYFFGRNKLQATLINKDTQYNLFWYHSYFLQIPGKRSLWMKITFESRTASAAQAEFNNYTDAFTVDFFLDKRGLDEASFN